MTAEVAPIEVPGPAWLIVEKGIRAGPYEVVIRARETVRVVARDVEAEVSCKGITLKFKLLDTELIIDVEMAATDFAMFVRRSVKELIEETLAKIGL